MTAKCDQNHSNDCDKLGHA